MAYAASLVACGLEYFDGSNAAVIAYLDAVDQKDNERAEIEHSNCILTYRNKSLWTSAKLACKLYNDGALLKFYGVKYFPAVMNAIVDFVSQSWQHVCTAATDPDRFKHLLKVMMARLNSIHRNIVQSAETTYNSLLEFIKGLVQKCTSSAGLNTFFLSAVSYIKTNWWTLAQSAAQITSAYIYDFLRVHFYKYVFQVTAVIAELNERLTAMATQLSEPRHNQTGNFFCSIALCRCLAMVTLTRVFLHCFTHKIVPPRLVPTADTQPKVD